MKKIMFFHDATRKTRTTCKTSTIFKDLNFLNRKNHFKIGAQTLSENIINHLNIWNFRMFRVYLSHILQLNERVRSLCESSKYIFSYILGA